MYHSETAKIRPVVGKWVGGIILDIGCGHDLIAPQAIGIDARPLPNVRLVTNSLYDIEKQLAPLAGKCDTVYSSHALEHLADDIRALKSWRAMLKPSGHLVLYLPDDRYYDNASNPEHVQIYTHDGFLMRVKEHLGWEPKASGLHVGDDLYSFWVVY